MRCRLPARDLTEPPRSKRSPAQSSSTPPSQGRGRRAERDAWRRSLLQFAHVRELSRAVGAQDELDIERWTELHESPRAAFRIRRRPLERVGVDGLAVGPDPAAGLVLQTNPDLGQGGRGEEAQELACES